MWEPLRRGLSHDKEVFWILSQSMRFSLRHRAGARQPGFPYFLFLHAFPYTTGIHIFASFLIFLAQECLFNSMICFIHGCLKSVSVPGYTRPSAWSYRSNWTFFFKVLIPKSQERESNRLSVGWDWLNQTSCILETETISKGLCFKEDHLIKRASLKKNGQELHCRKQTGKKKVGHFLIHQKEELNDEKYRVKDQKM